MEDALRTEYDLKQLKIRRLGHKRKSFAGNIVRLEPDVVQIFPNADAVNEALRFLIRVMQDNPSFASTRYTESSLKPED